ncbi:MAG: CcdB family protein [Natronohydrobacter sp.]|nr:CcdB family protein [Natronohydrobacter sp.]
MARFSVHDLPGSGRVVNLQSDFLDWADTRVVAPLIPLEDSPPPATHLNPVIALEDRQFVLIVQTMAAVRTSALGPSVGDLSDHQDDITRAVDMVFQGF